MTYYGRDSGEYLGKIKFCVIVTITSIKIIYLTITYFLKGNNIYSEMKENLYRNMNSSMIFKYEVTPYNFLWTMDSEGGYCNFTLLRLK